MKQGKKMNNPFTPLWQHLRKVAPVLWSYKSKVSEKMIRKRAALELLAGALWHLELASELGDFPKEKMSKFFEAKGGSKNPQPWEAWLEKSKGLSIEFPKDELLLRYRFSGPLDSAVSFLIQSMLIADAALRIDGARDLLRCKKSNHCLFARPKQIDEWLNKIQAGSLEEIKKHVITMVAFRDSYMHGEIPDKEFRGNHPQYSEFREKFFDEYSLSQVVEACREVWKELVKLASGGMGFFHSISS